MNLAFASAVSLPVRYRGPRHSLHPVPRLSPHRSVL